MKKCKYCMNKIDENATVCPNCRKSQKSKKIYLIVCIVIVLIISIFYNSYEEAIQSKEVGEMETDITKLFNYAKNQLHLDILNKNSNILNTNGKVDVCYNINKFQTGELFYNNVSDYTGSIHIYEQLNGSFVYEIWATFKEKYYLSGKFDNIEAYKSNKKATQNCNK